jgi:hypothetical protein
VAASPGAETAPDAANWLKAIEHQQVARRAYEIYRQNGCRPGRDVENWLQAEAEVRRELGQMHVASEPELVITASRGLDGELRVKSVAFKKPASAASSRDQVSEAAGIQGNIRN